MGKRNARSKQIGQSQPLFLFSPVQESGAETVKMLTRQPYSFFQKKALFTRLCYRTEYGQQSALSVARQSCLVTIKQIVHN